MLQHIQRLFLKLLVWRIKLKDIADYKGKALIFTTQEEQIQNKLYKTLNTVITINESMFHIMGTSKKPLYYPKKELTNQIGAAMGIEFSPSIIIQEIYGDIQINPDGSRTQKISGVKCIKQGKRRRPDGTWQPSSPCVYAFIWEDRAEEQILLDEDNVGQTWPDGNTKAKYNFPNDPAREKRTRRKLLLDLKKFAYQRASTGSELMVIRELTGMQTAFTPAEIKMGSIVCSQIVKSDHYQAKEAQARIDNIRLGGIEAEKANEAANLLTGSTTDVAAEFNNKFQRPEKEAPKAAPESFKHTQPVNPKHEATEPVEPGPGEEEEALTIGQQYTKLVNDDKVPEDYRNFLEENIPENGADDDFFRWAISEMEKLFFGGQS